MLLGIAVISLFLTNFVTDKHNILFVSALTLSGFFAFNILVRSLKL